MITLDERRLLMILNHDLKTAQACADRAQEDGNYPLYRFYEGRAEAIGQFIERFTPEGNP